MEALVWFIMQWPMSYSLNPLLALVSPTQMCQMMQLTTAIRELVIAILLPSYVYPFVTSFTLLIGLISVDYYSQRLLCIPQKVVWNLPRIQRQGVLHCRRELCRYKNNLLRLLELIAPNAVFIVCICRPHFSQTMPLHNSAHELFDLLQSIINTFGCHLIAAWYAHGIKISLKIIATILIATWNFILLGHYAPQLAQEIVRSKNSYGENLINLKGYLVRYFPRISYWLNDLPN